jgi:hypothetical protein
LKISPPQGKTELFARKLGKRAARTSSPQQSRLPGLAYRAFERVAIPATEIGCGPIRAFKKIQKRCVRIT